MSAIVIEVARTEPPRNGKKLATVVTAAGETLGIWPDKLGNLAVGRSYRVEVEENEFKGRTYRKITKAQPVTGNGNNAAAAPSLAEGSARPGDDGERAFVTRVLAASIVARAVECTQMGLTTAARMLRAVYRDAMR